MYHFKSFLIYSKNENLDMRVKQYLSHIYHMIFFEKKTANEHQKVHIILLLYCTLYKSDVIISYLILHCSYIHI